MMDLVVSNIDQEIVSRGVQLNLNLRSCEAKKFINGA
jgi:hypothetical protein